MERMAIENRLLANILAATSTMTVGKTKAARIVGGERTLERLHLSGAIECAGKGVASVVTDYLSKCEADDGYTDEKAEELCSHLRMSFAHYVYFKLAGDVNQNMTVTGLVKIKSANENQPPRQRMVKVWNDMVQLNKRFVEWAELSDYDVYYNVEMITQINQYNI